MLRSEFSFALPEHLIAQYPTDKRSDSRLLVVNGKKKLLEDKQFTDIEALLEEGDLLVFNNTKVIPARLYGQKATGGKIELLIERIVSAQTALAKIKSSKSPKVGQTLLLGSDHTELEPFEVEMIARHDELFEIKLIHKENLYEVLEQYGHIPLPPYVKRDDTELDFDRYQTVYAKEQGAVAAPTAGLHFDQPLLERLKAKGVNFAYVTLHVGAGTYQPVRADNILDHKMHSEMINVSKETVEQIKQTKKLNKRVIAVGTTSLRSLESSATFNPEHKISEFHGDSDIFIYPGYQFKVIDALLTNFHLSESTLFMLVSAFTSLDTMKKSYQHAIEQEYRFFSYGDAMFLSPNK